ncbi:glycerol kinase GlpK [Thauera aminoaromatica]|jgi:glycerol kinase|uniref:Glycerol kinase n=1 Tax=Thauera aminoaromatica TaxID=164330 RepID=A0A5C7T850_THASP|nr:glycerol kinase GlpK [Thauera aminoaromatica]MDA0233796.1 glycerol kinase GlpK [Pseudomonadota bacterium]MCK6397734.1 glycerol kinase GlpK [Thauera aminoaromatica]TXH91161.1 MAG: glycerol kinase GlpK [Thauera aminoaromatica]HMV94042.1 glycerol kinase GlpK [Thauera aminoaromatica]HNV90838.1 glycerol kinase GlpK [Thauera aminoaromatica]
MAYLLALDQGTTSSRAIVFDADGRVRGLAQQAFAQHFPAPDRVEHDPQDILRTQLDCAREALANAGVAAREVAAIGIANQRETTVLWERASGRALAPAIVWQDRRTAVECERLRAAGCAEDVRARTGLELDPYFSATKLAWLLDHVPDARVRAERGELAFGTIDSWLLWHLSGGRLHLTDAGNAARTLLFNLHTLDWDPVLLERFRIPPVLLPRVVASSGVCGETDPALFGAAIPIAGIGGDQQAATFGQACLAPGMAKNTYGTGCFLLMNTGHVPVASAHRLLTTVGWTGVDAAPSYALEGSVFMGGAVVQWLRDGLGLVKRASEVEALAASVPDSGGVVLVPAFTGLGAPYWDPHARGTLLGLSRGSGAAHIARAALEAIAMQSADLVQAMARDGAAPLAELRVDGGAAANDLLMQMQADLLGVPVLRPRLLETTAFGAACLAALGCGLWKRPQEIATHWQLDRRFEPRWPAARRDEARAVWVRAVERARAWAQD